MTEKLCLKWNDFQENINCAFKNLRTEKNFTDVTLVCEDGQQVEVHKVILAASSPFFQKLLEKNKHPHPLVYMRALKFEDLLALVDFLYVGEANLFQENLDSFLALTEELQLRGLMGKADENVGNALDGRPTNPVLKHSRSVKNDQIKNEAMANNVAAISTNLSENIEDLEENVKALMEQSSNNYSSGNRSWKGYRCKVC